MINDVSDLFFNIGTGNSISILELAKIMIKISGLERKPEFRAKLEGDIQKSHADISLLKKRFGWKPDVKLEDWLEGIFKK